MPVRELTGREKQAIRRLVKSSCANYDEEYGCLPLDLLHVCRRRAVQAVQERTPTL